jgi:hypothetical protein
VCEESRNQPPELLLRRIRELWEKLANSSRMHFDERDPRYFALVGECIVIYFALPSVPVRHPPLRDVVRPRDTSGCGEPEGIPLR